MKQFEGTAILSKAIGEDTARAMINEKINLNLDRYKVYGIVVEPQDDYVSSITENSDALIVTVDLKYSGECKEGVDLEMLIMDGELE